MISHDYSMSGINYNQRLTVHLPDGICRTLISSRHSGNEPKVIVYDKNNDKTSDKTRMD